MLKRSWHFCYEAHRISTKVVASSQGILNLPNRPHSHPHACNSFHVLRNAQYGTSNFWKLPQSLLRAPCLGAAIQNALSPSHGCLPSPAPSAAGAGLGSNRMQLASYPGGKAGLFEIVPVVNSGCRVGFGSRCIYLYVVLLSDSIVTLTGKRLMQGALGQLGISPWHLLQGALILNKPHLQRPKATARPKTELNRGRGSKRISGLRLPPTSARSEPPRHRMLRTCRATGHSEISGDRGEYNNSQTFTALNSSMLRFAFVWVGARSSSDFRFIHFGSCLLRCTSDKPCQL